MGIIVTDISGQLPVTRKPSPAPLDRFNEIIVHVTDAPNSTPQSTAHFHTAPPPQGRGWRSIAYHFYMPKDGTLLQTLPIAWVGSHCPPNYPRVGLVLVGRASDPMTPEQAAALPEALAYLASLTSVPLRSILGHREAMPGHTDCPGDSVLSAVLAYRATQSPEV